MDVSSKSFYKRLLAWVGSLVSFSAVVLLLHELFVDRLGCIENYGIAFGIGIPQELLLGINAIIVLSLFIFGIWHIKNSNIKDVIYKLLGLGLVLVGGSLNLYERFNTGFVCDYIRYARIRGNIADILVVVGCLLLGIVIIKNSKNEYTK